MFWASLLLLLLALLGAPLFAVIGAGALLGMYSLDVDLSVVAIEFFRIAGNLPDAVPIQLNGSDYSH